MAEPPLKRMSLAEFLQWEDGTDTRWELFDGVPVATAPPAVAHGLIAARLIERIGPALRARRPCCVQSEAGIVRPDRDDACYIADVAVSCTPPQRGQHLMRDPVLIVEVLSPSTIAADRQEKIPDYRQILSVQEIVAIDPVRVLAEIMRREGDHWLTELVQGRGAVLPLASVGLNVPMEELYDGLDLPEPAPGRALPP